MADKALLGVVAVGLALGFLAPAHQPDGPARQTPTEKRATATPTSPPRNGFSTWIDRSADGHFYATVNVNNQPVRFMIDTGASSVALTSADARRIGLNFDPAQFTPIAKGASGDVLGTLVTLDSMEIDGKRASGVRAAILSDDLSVSLLGQNFLAQFPEVRITGDRMELR